MPAYRAKNASLCVPIIATSTALINQPGMQRKDRATPVGALHRPPKPSWGGYWSVGYLARSAKNTRCTIGVCSGSVESTWGCSATTQTTQRPSPRRSRRAQSRAVTECESPTSRNLTYYHRPAAAVASSTCRTPSC
eukprot:207929-Prymnesium_polylepis.1